MQLEKRLNNIILSAFYEAKQEKHEYVTAEHIFYSSLFDEDVVKVLQSLELNVDDLKKELKMYLDQNIPRDTSGKDVVQSQGFQTLMNTAASKAASSNRTIVELGDVLVAIYDLEESYVGYLLRSEGIERYDLLNVISHGDYEPEEETESDGERTEKRMTPEELLEQFSVNLTEKAANGELDPIIGRENILDRTIQVLLRRKKNNPIHVGEPGVGKTAITEGLAQMIVDGDVPKPLLDHTVLRLDISNILAGTKYRGDFEKRMKKIIEALENIDHLILFIDEIHSMVGAGSAGNSNIDVASLLKPVLTEGKIKCIGATTYEEYRKHFIKDSALSRRFQKIDIPETTPEQTLEILKGIAHRYEDFHKVKYTQEALETAVELSSRYMSDRFLPDKAIDLIDEAGAYKQMKAGRKKTIDTAQIEKVVAFSTGRKERSVSRDRLKMLRNLENEIKTDIFGQDSAVDSVVRAVKRSFAGFSAVEKPVASFLFAGPTGVGKTELAKVLADRLSLPLHRFDMSEYQEKHSVAKLFGSPPGYVGYEEGGLLTEAVRKQPSCILLLDEIEKAHADIFNSLLQILDYATLTDNTGRKADFRNAVIIMTSNAGARVIGKTQTGFGERKFDDSSLAEAVKRTFSPEFRNRLSSIVYFNALDLKVVEDIVKKSLRELNFRMEKKNIHIRLTDAAVKHLTKTGFSKEFGARETARVVENSLEKALLDEILFGKLKKGGNALIDIRNGELFLKKVG